MTSLFGVHERKALIIQAYIPQVQRHRRDAGSQGYKCVFLFPILVETLTKKSNPYIVLTMHSILFRQGASRSTGKKPLPKLSASLEP